MHQLLYISQCQIPEAELENEIRKIRSSAALNNTRDGITGLFLLVENRFLQLMEGEEDKILSCFNRIKEDCRHKDLRVLVQRPVPQRLFPKWSMHYYRISREDALNKLGVEKMPDLSISNWQENFKSDLAIMLMESFARLGTI